MQYFDIQTIKTSIEAIQNVSSNWLIPSFVLAANDVGTGAFVDLAKGLGTDQFLDRYFRAELIDIPSFSTGNNLLRPRMRGIKWDTGVYAGDYVIRQDTKMWANLYSSRGYREMRMRGFVEGEKTTARLTDTFQPAFEAEIPQEFEFEDFMVWLFAFSGFPDEITTWQALFDHLLAEHFGLQAFQPPYVGRFRVTSGRAWPVTINVRPTDRDFQNELAPALMAILAAPVAPPPAPPAGKPLMSPDDAVLAKVLGAITKGTSHSFLLAGPPGTGKTKYAHDIADYLTDADEERILFLQFHPAFGYDDFVEGFRPAKAAAGLGGGGVVYELQQRHFLQFAEKAKKDLENNYVLVIDELNRGDVARIFGELLTYLELDYREKDFTLAISGEVTKLPKNLILLATANPFDRSVTDLDDALLRRFVVIMLEPDKAFLQRYLTDAGVEARVVTRTLRLFDLLNENFPSGFGHTSFLRVETIEDLADVWEGRVQLGLQRTMFHDRQKYDAVRADIDALLKVDEEAEAAGAEAAEE